MRRLLLFLGLLVVILVAWYFSITFVTGIFGEPKTLSESGDMFGGVNALFSGLALAGVIYAVILQTVDVKTNQKNLEKSIEANRVSSELVALAALIQEGNSALERYDRWSENSPKDYSKAQKTVRDKIKLYREQVEQRLSEIRLEK